MKYMNDPHGSVDPKVYMAMEGTDKKATWTSELDQMSNSGAHSISEEFVCAKGQQPYEEGNHYGKMVDYSVPGNRDISVDWGSVDSKLGAQVAFNAKADV